MKKLWILLFAMSLVSFVFVISSPASEIKSIEVIKVGPAAIAKNIGKTMTNEMFKDFEPLQQNPYEVQRPVLIRVTYRCEPKQKWSPIDVETAQTKDKWGEWITDKNELREIVYKKCGEESPYEKAKRKELSRQKESTEHRVRFSNADRLKNSALLVFLNGTPENAIEKYNELIEEYPEYATENEYHKRGVSYLRIKDYQKAQEDFDKVIALNPKYAGVYYDRGYAYAGLSNYDQASKDFGKAIELNPKDAYAYNHLADINRKLGKYEEAMDNYNEAIKQIPDNGDAYYNKACLFAIQKNDVQACNWLRLAIEKGFTDWKDIQEDKDFDNIRKARCFIDLRYATDKEYCVKNSVFLNSCPKTVVIKKR